MDSPRSIHALKSLAFLHTLFYTRPLAHIFLLYRRLVDVLEGGPEQVATEYAVATMHHLAAWMPVSKDLLLAAGALGSLVELLQDSLSVFHYTLAKVKNVSFWIFLPTVVFVLSSVSDSKFR